MTEVRDAGPADIAAITRIYRQSVECGTASFELVAPSKQDMQHRFEAIRADGYPFIVAVNGEGSVVGYAYASAHNARPAYCWSVQDSIYLDKNARGRGVGKLLLLTLIERCEALGFRQMIATIGGPEPASVALHRALGFVHIGTLSGAGSKFGRWLDTAIMQRTLGDGTNSDPDQV
ncbi:MAG: N-acetyltransferase family protein [Pseudomonadota bacterium]